MEGDLLFVDAGIDARGYAVDIQAGHIRRRNCAADIAGRAGLELDNERCRVVDPERDRTMLGEGRDHTLDRPKQMGERIDHVNTCCGHCAGRGLSRISAPIALWVC